MSATLAAVLGRLIPADEWPGALGLDLVIDDVPGLGKLLERLARAEDLDEALSALEHSGDAAFITLVEAAHAAYYADPRSWPALGYTTNVPGRP